MDASIAAAYLRREPVLFYYWSPTAVMGKYDLVKLEEAPYSDACWEIVRAKDGERTEACAFPEAEVVYGLSKRFHETAPVLVDVLEKAVFPVEVVNKSLAYMSDAEAEPADAARRFLRERKDLWTGWVSEEAAARIEAGLD